MGQPQAMRRRILCQLGAVLAVLGLSALLTAPAAAQTYELLTPTEYVMKRALEKFGDGLEQGAQFYAGSRTLDADITQARKDFQRCRGDCRQIANRFATLLVEKDKHYVSMELINRMDLKAGVIFRTFAGGDIDGGVPLECKTLYDGWLREITAGLGNGDIGFFIGAMNGATPAYAKYAACRDDLENALAGR